MFAVCALRTSWCTVLCLILIISLFTMPDEVAGGADGMFLTSDETDQISRNVSALLDRLLDPNIYDKHLRPGNGVHPTLVKINMHLKSLGPVSEDEKSYVLDCYFRQEWNDERLQFDFKGFESLAMNYKFLEKVWKPDTYFVNGKKSYLHKITVPNRLLRLKNDGTMLYSQRLTVKAVCPMRLKKFPLDKQSCPLEIASFGYPTSDVVYQWRDGGVTFEEGVSLAQYEFINSSVTEGVSSLSTAEEKSACFVVFHLQRNAGYYLLQVYIPCCLIVCCSWVSFWIHKKDTPARVVIGVTTVLTITTMGFGGRAQMPKTSYATALDWFVIMCFSFVFASLVEYASINFLDTRQKRMADLKKKLEDASSKPEPPTQPPMPNQSEAIFQMSRPDFAMIPSLPPIHPQMRPASTSFEPSQFHQMSVHQPYSTANVALRRRDFPSQHMMFPVLPPAPMSDIQLATIRPRTATAVKCPRPPTPRHLSPAVVDQSTNADLDMIEAAGSDFEEENFIPGGEDDFHSDSSDPQEDHGPESLSGGFESFGGPPGFEPPPFIANSRLTPPLATSTLARQSSQPNPGNAGHDHNLLRPLSNLGRRLSALHSMPTGILSKLPSLTVAPPAPGAPEKSSVIDIQARRFFPLAFIGLNTIYWLAYSYYITDGDDEIEP